MQTKYPINSSIILTRGREHSLKKRHHWIFSGAVAHIEGSPTEGDLVWVKDHKGKVLGYGFYGMQSIAVRILSFDPNIKPEDQVFGLIKNARKKRKKIGFDPNLTNSYRLFHSEGDSLPGLTIDKFDTIFVIQIHHPGILPFLDLIKDYLLKKFPDLESIILKSGKSQEEKDNFRFLHGEKSKCIIKENGVLFHVDVIAGQKTGFFLDQRESRALIGSLTKDKSVLNLFCFSGGFSIYALLNGASRVVSVDSSEAAIETAKANIKLSNLEEKNFEFVLDNCENYLNTEEEKFDIIICDPPALVKNKKHLHKGMSHYKKLQELALQKVNVGGLFFSFSCSQFVSDKDLEKAILTAAKENGVTLKKIYSLEQAACHVVNSNHLESKYLKGFGFELCG